MASRVNEGNGYVAKRRVRPYTKTVKQMMGDKSHVLSKAQALSDIGMAETAEPLWLSAASYEEQIAPVLDALGRDLEAALHRTSAASCYRKARELSRAANLYRAAFAGPLEDDTRCEVEQMLTECLAQLGRRSGGGARDA